MPEYGRAVATFRDADHLDVFMCSAENTLVHTWVTDTVQQFDNAYDLGGDLDSDPVAIRRFPQGMNVFARSRRQTVLHWEWDVKGQSWSDPEELPAPTPTDPTLLGTVPATVATDLAAVADDDTLYVFARSIDGPIRWWIRPAGGPWAQQPVLWSEEQLVSDPIVVRSNPGEINVYVYAIATDATGTPTTVVQRFQIVNGTPTPFTMRAGAFKFDQSHRITAFSWGPNRQDVYVRAQRFRADGGLGPDGVPIHWGRGFLATPDTHDGFFGPELIGPEGAVLDHDPFATNRGAGDADLFYRDAQRNLHHWAWRGTPNRKWVDLGLVDGTFAYDPVVVSRNEATAEIVQRLWVDGRDTVSVSRWQHETWSHLAWETSLTKADPPQDPLAGSTDDDAPQYLIVRPDDHLLLGLNAPSFAFTESEVPHLTDGDGRLLLTFPPQHVAEEVSRPGTTPAAGYWGASLSGPSRLAVLVSSDLFLTAAGLLTELEGQSVDGDESRSAIELPRGLIVAPEAPVAGQSVVIRHSIEPVGAPGVDGGGVSIGLWRTRLGTAAGDGGLNLHALRAGRDDEFPVALSKADRILIAEQGTPATADRLELSSLGGTLTASGRWGSFEWDHRAVLGRDHAVRTSVKGVLYPFGHEAVWVEMTERSHDEDTAVLRKFTTLYVVDPVVRPTAAATTAELRNGFPFTEVELAVREVRDLEDPDWTTFPRRTKDAVLLQDAYDSLEGPLQAARARLFPPGAPALPLRLTEDLALNGTPSERQDAREIVTDYAGQLRILRQLAVLEEIGVDIVGVPTYFTPTTQHGPFMFHVRCRAANGDVHFAMPLVFVADINLADDLRPPFKSLTDPGVATTLRGDFTRSGAGVVEFPGGTPIDLLPLHATVHAAPGDSTVQSTIHEIRRLNIVGNLTGIAGTYCLPSLGLPTDPASWSADIGLPTLRSLLGADLTARINYAEDYLRGVIADVPLKIRGAVDSATAPLKDLVADFTAAADRTGALAAPNMVLNGISQAHGLINAEADRVLGEADSLDPKKLLAHGATLLGFDLSDLVTDVKLPPELKTITRVSLPNEVVMTWKNVALTAWPTPPPNTSPDDSSAFIPGPASSLDIEVISAPDHNETTCTVTDFKMRMPPGKDALIEITFARVQYHQTIGTPPQLHVDVTDVQLLGELKLLAELMEKVGGLDKVPLKVEASKDKVVARYSVPIPDVAAMSFTMSNLLFSAALTVPFDGDPVAMEIAFASRERPFTLTVLMFGGGGYVDLELIHSGLRRLEVSLQFGAAIGMNFGVGKAEVHAFGGIRYALVSGHAKLTGYISLGGSLNLLGLVSVSIELRVELAYDFDTNSLVGRAKIVVDVDVTLFSDSFELDSGEWVIAGGSAAHHALGPPEGQPFAAPPLPGPTPFVEAHDADDAGFKAWQAYRRAFA